MQKPGFVYSCWRSVPAVSLTSSLFLCLSLHLHLIHASYWDSISPEDHNHLRSLELKPKAYDTANDGNTVEIRDYEPDFLGSDRGIIGRADPPKKLVNNSPGKEDIDNGDTQFWTFPRSELNTRLDTLYITLTICDQPQPKVAEPDGAPSPLQLYISTDNRNQKPDKKDNNYAVSVEYGYGSLDLPVSSDTQDIYFAVTAPEETSQYKGTYTYWLTGSTDEPFVTYNDSSGGMVLIDSDSSAALLSSVEELATPNYSVFVHPQEDPAIWGLQRSFCGLEKRAMISGRVGDLPSNDIDTSTLKLGGGAKRQFYIKNLNGSSAYYSMLAIDGNATSGKARDGVVADGGGSKVWKTLNFTTKAPGNCAVIYNLTFCSDVAYAVPVHPDNKTNLASLAQIYDNDAHDKYQNFNKSLQQVPCNTTSTAQYSLARNCDDCARDYRTWLCAVTIPRCEDYSVNASYLMSRALLTNSPNGSTTPDVDESQRAGPNKSAAYMMSSRNPMIDDKIHPGFYKELLPCEDLCYEIVRSCPASLGFACPLKDHGLYDSYGKNGTGLTCNYPGAAFQTKGLASVYSWDIWVVTVAFAALWTNLCV